MRDQLKSFKQMAWRLAGSVAQINQKTAYKTTFVLSVLMLTAIPTWGQQVFTGVNTSDTTTAFGAFRTAIGGADNSLTPTAQASGRREINWDAVRLDGADFNGNTTTIVANKITGIPVNRFQARGVAFKEIFAVSNDGFASANAGVANQFPAFSTANTFVSFNSNKIETRFVLASAPATTPVAAATRGFGAIFLDVEQANTSSIEYFNGAVSLGKWFVPVGPSGQAQFLGVLFNAPIVTRVIITMGQAQVFNFNNGQVTAGQADVSVNALQYTDQVATDDFIYGEPLAVTAPNVASAFAASSTTEATTSFAEFRTAIGGADNSLTPTAQASGRREINWDAVRLDGADFNNNTTVIVANKITGIPVNRFQARGARFDQVLAVANDGFVGANANAANQFPAFSTANTFASFNSNKYEVQFVLASAPATTPVPASTRGFGAIFLDVEQPNTSSIEYFNGAVSLGKFFVPVGASGQAQFLGVLFSSPVVTKVVVTTGTNQVFNFSNSTVTAGGSESDATDLVILDDFIYGEPVLNSAHVSAGSYDATALATESIAAAFGANLAAGVAVAATTPLPTTLLGATVKVKDSVGTERLAPLFFVSPVQINYLVPANTVNGDAVVTITTADGRVATGRTKIETVTPSLFSANANGQGIAAAVVLRIRVNGELVYESIATFDSGQQRFVATPIDLGPATDNVFLVLYGTGLRYRSGVQGVTVKLGGNIDSQVLFAGWLQGFVGLDQINASLPRSLVGRGEIDVVMTVDGKTTNTVKVNIK